jgi:hypothetical protein
MDIEKIVMAAEILFMGAVCAFFWLVYLAGV